MKILEQQSKYENCQYTDRLLKKLSQLNQQASPPIDIDEIRKGIYYAKNIMVAKCDNQVSHITPIR